MLPISKLETVQVDASVALYWFKNQRISRFFILTKFHCASVSIVKWFDVGNVVDF